MKSAEISLFFEVVKGVTIVRHFRTKNTLLYRSVVKPEQKYLLLTRLLSCRYGLQIALNACEEALAI